MSIRTEVSLKTGLPKFKTGLLNSKRTVNPSSLKSEETFCKKILAGESADNPSTGLNKISRNKIHFIRWVCLSMTEGVLVFDVVRRQKKLTKLLKCLKCKGYTESEGKWNDGVSAGVESELV